MKNKYNIGDLFVIDLVHSSCMFYIVEADVSKDVTLYYLRYLNTGYKDVTFNEKHMDQLIGQQTKYYPVKE